MALNSQPMVKIRFEGKNLADCDFFTKSDPYLVLSRPASKGVYDFKQVRKTETIRNNLNPSWKLIYISMTELCDNDFSMPIRITVFDYDHNTQDDLIGETETTLGDLMGHCASGSPLVLKIGLKRRGELYVRQCEAENTQTRKMTNSSYPERNASNASLGNYSASAPPQCYNQPQQMYSSHMQQPHFAQPQEVYRPHLTNHQPPTGNSFYQPAMSYYQQPQMSFTQPQMNYHQQTPMNYQQAPMSYHQAPASFQNCPQIQQHSTFPAFPDDPTDRRPQSIWINP